MGRNLYLWNSIIYIAGVILVQENILTALRDNGPVYFIFHVVGIGSILAYFWFTILSKETFPEFCRDAALAGFVFLLAASPSGGSICYLLSVACLVGFIYQAVVTRHLGLEWLIVILLGFCWLLGASFYFYMPLAGMSDPPMMWGYPRTVEGFIHAFTRGQYEHANPANPFRDPMKFVGQLIFLGKGIKDEFSMVTAFLALVPFAFFLKMHRRERAWLLGQVAIYCGLGFLLLILLNPGTDKAAVELNRVFFTASHTVVAILVGYGLTLTSAYMATHYQRFRAFGLIGGAVAAALALYGFVELNDQIYFGATSVGLLDLLKLTGHAFTNKDQYGLPIFAGLLLIGLAVAFVAAMAVYKTRAPLAISLVIFALMPLHSMMTHWSDNEQHEHWFGYWFGHDMFTPPFKWADGKPLYPEMARNALLYGGTDPGRFCPTYMIFCDSFVPRSQQPKQDPDFDRRDVYLITQNALADGTYLNYIRAQYNRSAQKDPPFFQGFVDYIQTLALPEADRKEKTEGRYFKLNSAAKIIGWANFFAKPLDNYFTDLGDRIEKRRRTFTSWFTDKEFTDVAGFATKLRNQGDPVSKYLYQNLSAKTQQLLAGPADSNLGRALSTDLNALLERELVVRKRITEKEAEKAAVDQEIADGEASSRQRDRQAQLVKELAALPKPEPLYDPERFKQVEISEYLQDFIKQNPQSHTRIRLNRLLLEAAYPKEILHSKGGVYPDREIDHATPDDSQKCFQEYLQDAQKRLNHDQQFPNEPHQIKPGEDVHIVENRVQVSGQIAVMAINGLITKVIFDKNPKTEFYVEESFPLDWMYPHLTPFGIIMKINRQPLPELSEDICKTDHEFWKQFSTRLTGDIIDYDTPIKDIAAYIEKVYLRRDFSTFKGDRKFVRDDQGQKAFSKLRSSIGGVYAWRIANSKPNSPEQQRMVKEADFAFKQAFAFCPYSPEAVFRYVNLLFSLQKFDDASVIANTALKLDPNNPQVRGLVDTIQNIRRSQGEASDPGNVQAAFNAAAGYLQVKNTNGAIDIFDRVLNTPGVNPEAVLFIAQRFAELNNYPKLESAIEKLSKLRPDQADVWYDLAGIKVYLNKPQEALPPLRKAIELSDKRRITDPKARDLRVEAQTDPKFGPLRQTPEFKQLTGAK
jgi:tetratricopeptide (TPR) repeat protein